MSLLTSIGAVDVAVSFNSQNCNSKTHTYDPERQGGPLLEEPVRRRNDATISEKTTSPSPVSRPSTR
ncbi:hypothetical protein AGR1C_Cc30054 [Agrobacterium fabacearum TT111]|nr:hypothetical protein AGR1C_Cc30054 [Agrobacterium fabacearum TT111]